MTQSQSARSHSLTLEAEKEPRSQWRPHGTCGADLLSLLVVDRRWLKAHQTRSPNSSSSFSGLWQTLLLINEFTFFLLKKKKSVVRRQDGKRATVSVIESQFGVGAQGQRHRGPETRIPSASAGFVLLFSHCLPKCG